MAGALLTSAQPAQALDSPTNDVPLDMETYVPLVYPFGLSVFNLYADANWDTNNPGFQMADIDAATAALTASNFFDKTAQYGVPDLTFAGSAQAKSFCPFPTFPTDDGPETSSVALVAFLLCEEATPGTGVPYSFGDRIYNVIVPSTWTINDFGSKSCSSYGGYHFIIPSAPAIPFGIPPPGRPIIYTVIPAKCFADVSNLMFMISHEAIEAATDPNPLPGHQSWIDTSTLDSISSLFAPLRWGEAADICEQRGNGRVSVTYSGIAMKVGAYWSNHDNACVVGPARVVTARFEATGLSGFPVSVTVNGVAHVTPIPIPPMPYTETVIEGATYSFPDVVTDSLGRRFRHAPGACSGSITFPVGNTTANATAAITCAYAADTTPPVIAAHGDETAEATSAAGAAVGYTSPATSDDVDGAGVATCVPASGSTFALGTTTVTCNATDAAGNAATPTGFSVTVQDTAPPLIAAHGNETAEATGAAGAAVAYTSPATSDAVDGAGVATCVPPSGSTFALGTTSVTCNATDAAGNAATPTGFSVTVQDTTPPLIAAHGNETAEATSAAGAAVAYTSPATSDAVDGAGVATCVPASGSTFALGATTVTCNATDAAGNAATPTTFSVTVQDTTPPVIAAHGNETAEATSAAGAAVSYTSPATSDAVDGAGGATCVPASGSTFALGSTTVTCDASDSEGNAATPTTFSVTVQDTTPPVIAAHGNETAEATSAAGAAVSYMSPATSDTVDGAGVATCAPASGSTFALGTTTVTCNAADAAGNAATPTTFSVTVRDTTPPVITCPPGIVGIVGQPVVLGSASGIDTVDAAPVMSNNAPATFGPGTTTVRWTATDASGNAATCAQIVILRYNFFGFFSPVDMPAVVNMAKAGSTIPLKWRLTDFAGGNVTDVATVASTISFRTSCSGAASDEIEETTIATGGTALRYDAMAQQFVYSWATLKSWTGTCRTLVLTLNDGTIHIAYFKFR